MSSGRPQLRSQGRLRFRCTRNGSVLWPGFRCSRGCIRLRLVIHVLLKDISCTGPDVPGPQRVCLGFGREALHWERPARTGRQLCHSLWLLFVLSAAIKARYPGQPWQPLIPSGVAFAIGMLRLLYGRDLINRERYRKLI
jgi:hypothetical protein